MGRKGVLQEIAGSRPFPVDKERQRNCLLVLDQIGMTQTEMALHLGVSRQVVSRVISGRQPIPAVERRIAVFLGVPENQLFPVRTAGEIARMREAEEMAKSRKASLRQARLAARANAGGVA